MITHYSIQAWGFNGYCEYCVTHVMSYHAAISIIMDLIEWLHDSQHTTWEELGSVHCQRDYELHLHVEYEGRYNVMTVSRCHDILHEDPSCRYCSRIITSSCFYHISSQPLVSCPVLSSHLISSHPTSLGSCLKLLMVLLLFNRSMILV